MTWFPSGNMMGPAGGAIRGVLLYAFGVSAFVGARCFFAVVGLHTGGGLVTGRGRSEPGSCAAAYCFLGPVLLRSCSVPSRPRAGLGRASAVR